MGQTMNAGSELMRTHCCILGCRRSTKHEYIAWICVKHWKLVPKKMKRVFSRAKKRYRLGQRRPSQQMAVIDRLWERIVREATNISVGVR